MAFAENIRLLDQNGVPYGIRHVDNKPRVSAISYLYDIAEGNVSDHDMVLKFGHNSDVASVEETVCDLSTDHPWAELDAAAGATQWRVKAGGNAADTNGGTGANTIQVYGLDANYVEQNETVTLNGANAVNLSNSYQRMFRGIVRTVGSGLNNAGNIIVEFEDTGGGVWTDALQISTGMNQTLMALWTVPANKTFYLVQFYTYTSSSKATQVYLRVRPFGESFQVKKLVTIFEGGDHFPYLLPLSIAEKSDIQVSADTSGGGGEVSAGFDGWYEGS